MVITDAINVFVPIYTKRDDLKQQYDKYNDWCRINCDKFLDVDVKAIWENINVSSNAKVTKNHLCSIIFIRKLPR